ncbi:MAG TPA: isochorismatase family protein [Opitutaceae bacterium]|nr:isochorismatase family protein [Opitutaceae bacterium]
MSAPGPETLDRALLVVIDMQPGFLKAIPGGDAVTRRCAFAISAAALVGIPVAFTEQVPAKLGPTDPALFALAPGAAVFGKDTFSACNDTAFAAALEARGTTHLLLAGIETPVCVFQTALGALGRGLHVTILSDAVGARRADDATDVLRYLAMKGCHILPSESVFYSVLGGAMHPRFREYTALVKQFN